MKSLNGCLDRRFVGPAAVVLEMRRNVVSHQGRGDSGVHGVIAAAVGAPGIGMSERIGREFGVLRDQ